MEIVKQQEEQKVKTKTKTKKRLSFKNPMKKTGVALRTLFTKRKKLLILSTMFVLLCVTGYLNFTLNAKEPNIVATGATYNANVWQTMSNNRANIDSRNIMILQDLIATAEEGQSKETLRAQLTTLLERIGFETSVESRLLAEGYEAVMVDKTENGFINVLLKSDAQITQDQADKIHTILFLVDNNLDEDNVRVSVM
jgi:hypothetical protein